MVTDACQERGQTSAYLDGQYTDTHGPRWQDTLLAPAGVPADEEADPTGQDRCAFLAAGSDARAVLISTGTCADGVCRISPLREPNWSIMSRWWFRRAAWLAQQRPLRGLRSGLTDL